MVTTRSGLLVGSTSSEVSSNSNNSTHLSTRTSSSKETSNTSTTTISDIKKYEDCNNTGSTDSESDRLTSEIESDQSEDSDDEGSVDGESSGAEFERSKCCHCEGMVSFTDYYTGDWECMDCKHVRCEDCTQYDSDNYSILSGDEMYEVPQYRIEDDEADNCLLLMKYDMGNDTKDIVEEGVNNIDLVKVAFPKRIESKVLNMAGELKRMIAFDALTPEKRVIALAWSHRKRCWTYRRYVANKVPFIIVAFGGVLKTRAMNTLFSAAPQTDIDAYPWFNYKIDHLFFEYKRCGSRDRDYHEYIESMKTAANHLRDHIDGGGRPVKHIKVTWCQLAEDPARVLNFFRGIRGLLSITLKAHDHYKGAYEDPMTNHANRWQYDPSEMQKMVNRGELTGYPFQVRLFSGDWNGGEQYIRGVKPPPGRGDDDEDSENSEKDSDEENGSDEEHESEEGDGSDADEDEEE